MKEFEKWLQSRLTSHGFPVGTIDGDIGPVTLKALKSFQKSRGLHQSGQADKATVEALRSTSVGNAQRPETISNAAGIIPTATQWPTQAGVPSFYGEVGTSQTSIELPYDMFLAWDKGQRVRKMTLHTKVAASAQRVFEKVADKYNGPERKALGLDLFGGSLNVRKMRGGNSWSMHSWGIAIDFDPERNALHTSSPKARLSHADAVPFWEFWEEEGWLSLGRARNYDWMHVQAARL